MAMLESSTTIRGETSAISSAAGRDGGIAPAGPVTCSPQGGGGPGKITLPIYVRYLVSSPCVVTPGGLETKRPVSELYGRSGSPAAPRVTITSSPASAGLFLVRFGTNLVWNGFLPLAFVIYLTNGAMGCDDQGRRVSRQGTRVRRTRPEQTRNSFIKEQFLEVAKKWRQMAEHEDNR